MVHPTRWTEENWRRIGLHAAPEAFGVMLADLRREIVERQKAADRLATMLARRQQQVSVGEWPPAPEGGA